VTSPSAPGDGAPTASRSTVPVPSAPTGPPPDWTPEQIAAASTQEIAQGRLPLQAQWRINEQRHQRDAGEAGAFTSALSVQEFAAIRSVGFSPVGQVLGSAVYNVGWSYSGCGYVGAYGGMRYGGGFNSGGFSGRGMGYGGGYGRGWQPAPVVDVPAVRNLLEQARHRAVERMREECAGLDGDGVVGVRLTVQSFYGNGLEFMAIGTAVRADGPKRPKRPFTSDLSGQDFAKLLRAGWAPVDLVQGVGAVIRHDDWAQRMQQSSWMNQEVVGTTQLVTAARAGARDSLAKDAAKRGGHSVVLQKIQLNVFEANCAYGGEAHDHLADAFIWGTAIVPIDARGKRYEPDKPLTMLRLDRKDSTKGRR
jgi:uncharacterized protein YbjQ (UPF0145 family)